MTFSIQSIETDHAALEEKAALLGRMHLAALVRELGVVFHRHTFTVLDGNGSFSITVEPQLNMLAGYPRASFYSGDFPATIEHDRLEKCGIQERFSEIFDRHMEIPRRIADLYPGMSFGVVKADDDNPLTKEGTTA